MPKDVIIEENTAITPDGKIFSYFYDEDNKEFIINGNETSNLNKYILLRSIKIPVGAKVLAIGFEIPNTAALGIVNGIYTGKVDIELDFAEFNNAVTLNGKVIDMPLVLRVYSKLGYIPAGYDKIKSFVDKHNTFLKGERRRDAAYNFVSIIAKDISKSPINQIQAQAAIDVQTDFIKDLLVISENPDEENRILTKLVSAANKLDRGSVYSKYFMLTLTLAGKENVGIVASSMKTFEAISQYVNQVLDEGTELELEELAFNISINGHKVNMIANAHARNIISVTSERAREILSNLNLEQDQFLVISALLSLATDNAKDPILAKLNAGPKMMSLFTAGVMLGLSVKEISLLTLSPTGLLLDSLMKGDVFEHNKGFSRLGDAIKYIQRPPTIGFTKLQLRKMSPIFKSLGLIKEDEELNEKLFKDIIIASNTNGLYRNQLKKLFRALLTSNSTNETFTFVESNYIQAQIAFLRNSREYKRFSPRAASYLESLESKEELTDEEKNTISDLKLARDAKKLVLDKIKALYAYLDGREEYNILIADLLEPIERIKEGQNVIDSIKLLRSELYNHQGFTNYINEILNWIECREIVDNDYIEGYDEWNHKVINEIAKLDKVASEMAALRPFLALNQGLPNTIEEQITFLTLFTGALSTRLNNSGKKEELQNSELLLKLASLNSKLFTDKKINSTDNYYVDLNSFIQDPEYRKAVLDAYELMKVTTNIYKVITGVDNYFMYLQLNNLVVELMKSHSGAYRANLKIIELIVPQMNLTTSALRENVRKQILPSIYRQLNTNFLRSINATYTIPNFVMDSNGVLQILPGILTIRLGYKKDNEIFKQWIQYIVFPQLKKKYPTNKFLQFLGYRKYDYNADHNYSINIAKVNSIDPKNVATIVAFDEAKSDLVSLPTEEITKFFYYNLIAYNNLPGQLSLTDLFEDIVGSNYINVIKGYNTYIAENETNNIELENPLIEIAPLVPASEVTPDLNIPYIYVLDSSTNKVVLLLKFNSVPETDEYSSLFEITMASAKYGAPTLFESESDEYKVNDDDTIFVGLNKYSVQELKDIAKKKGFGDVDDIIIEKVSDGEKIYVVNKDKVNTILNDDLNC